MFEYCRCPLCQQQKEPGKMYDRRDDSGDPISICNDCVDDFDDEVALEPYTSEVVKDTDRVMSYSYNNGQWYELQKAILVYELMYKESTLEGNKAKHGFYWAMRDRLEYLSELMAKKRIK